MGQYTVYDYFLKKELDSEDNYAEDITDVLNNWAGWHLIMGDGAGLTGDRIATWAQGDIGMVSFMGGATDTEITALPVGWTSLIENVMTAAIIVGFMGIMIKIVK